MTLVRDVTTPLTSGEAAHFLTGGRITGCSRDRSAFWPIGEVTYAARLFVPGRGMHDLAGETPLRTLLAVDPATGQRVDRVRPCAVGTACLGVWHNGALRLLVFEEEIEAFVCPPSP